MKVIRLDVKGCSRLLARILKGGGGGGGSRKRSSGKPSQFTLLHISICSKLGRNFSNILGFVSTEFVPICFFT